MAGTANHKSVGYLVLLTIAVGVAAGLLARVPENTPTGRRLVERLRRANAHLSPTQDPAWAVYGASGAALGVALFGMGSLWAADPAFAGGVDLARGHRSIWTSSASII